MSATIRIASVPGCAYGVDLGLYILWGHRRQLQCIELGEGLPQALGGLIAVALAAGLQEIDEILDLGALIWAREVYAVSLSVIEYVFLRLYGRTLTRPRRNDPDAACSDAIMQTSMFLSPLILSVFWAIAAFALPSFAVHLKRLDDTFVGVTVGMVVAITYLIGLKFKKYAGTPQLADAYRGSAARRITRILLITLPILWVVLIGVALRVFRPT